MKVLVTGVSGQLGYDVCKELTKRNIEHLGTSSKDLDITDKTAVEALMREYHPDAVIHCAAYTKVDLAEDEPEKCWAVNVDGTKNVAAACRELGAKMVYISTDYVFPGTGEKPYEPTDPVGPVNTYGRSKLAGELAVQSLMEQFFIVRISWVFGKNGNNFVKTMLRLAETRTELNVVSDQIGSPTYTANLAPLLCDLVQTEKYGVYHATNEGTCSWAEFAEAIFELAGKKVIVHPIPTSEYPTRAVRPLNSRMSKDCLEENGFSQLPHWKAALEDYLKFRSEKQE